MPYIHSDTRILKVSFLPIGCEQAQEQGPLPKCVSKPASPPGIGGWRPNERKEILEFHNFLRQNVLKGAIPGLPKAKVMKELVWDEELANEAQR